MSPKIARVALALCIPAAAVAAPAGAAGAEPPAAVAAPAAAAERLVASLPPALAELAREVLARNPDLARARHEAVAAELRAPQVAALPDPMATVTAFLVSPETRVGPQRLAAGVSQRLPWFGKLALREQEALWAAAAARAAAGARAVALVTETRRLAYDLAFLAAQEAALQADRATLEHYEELARARYASGVGLEQAVVKLQAEITKDESRLLEIAQRRAALAASLNALRDAGPETPLPVVVLPVDPGVEELPLDRLRQAALAARPEVARARSQVAEAETGVELAKKEFRPDVTLGLAYTLVGRREDAAGRAMPPEGNGDDVVGLTAGVNLPVWRGRLAAGLEAATERESAAREGLRAVVAEVDRSLGDLTQRIPLTAEQHRLFAEVLTVQAEEALRSAEGAYGSGNLGALDLLDAERVQLEVRIGAARALADLAIAVAQLEGAAATPLGEVPAGPSALPSETPEPQAAGPPVDRDDRSSGRSGGETS